MRLFKEPFGKLWNQEASLYTLQNNHGMSIKITDYGGIITHLFVPDRNGDKRDIVLGFDDFKEYLAGHPFFGAIVGRFANRINAGRFALNGQNYQLAAQSFGNHLHGGIRGFDKYIWESYIEESEQSITVVLLHHSPDGDEGYPGNLDASVHYTLHADNRLSITYKARTDKTTIINLTNHSYFNLCGNLFQDITGHRIQINAERFVEVNEQQIPTGMLPELKGSYLDCIDMRSMKDMFSAAPEGSIDHCYVLADNAGKMRRAAIVEAENTGIRMILDTDNAGVQFYNGNKLGAQAKVGKDKILYQTYGGFCLETQCFPDTPNHPKFPSCVLYPGDEYSYSANFRFETF